MDTELIYYDVYPRIVREYEQSKITIRPVGQHVAFIDDEYIIEIIPIDRQVDRGVEQPIWQIEKICTDRLIVKNVNGILIFRYKFSGEQIYSLHVFSKTDESKAIAAFSLYCVSEDLYELKPYRIEMHAHTNNSDGAESVDFIPHYYRMHGYDTLSITDHCLYEPSIQAIRVFKDIPSTFRLYPGEEIHAPLNPIHFINFAGSFSINAFIRQNQDLYKSEIETIISNTKIPDTTVAYQIASCIWISRKIRESGGLSILAHPHWRPYYRGQKINYNISHSTFLYLLENKVFDAWEIFGYSTERNNTHLALYLEALRRGMDIPVVATNDSHGVAVKQEWFDKAYTIVLAGENKKEDLISQIKAGFCAAVERQKDMADRVIGTPRMIMYARFLIDHFYPFYDRCCQYEGQLLRTCIMGIPGALKAYEQSMIYTNGYFRHFFYGQEMEL